MSLAVKQIIQIWRYGTYLRKFLFVLPAFTRIRQNIHQVSWYMSHYFVLWSIGNVKLSNGTNSCPMEIVEYKYNWKETKKANRLPKLAVTATRVGSWSYLDLKLFRVLSSDLRCLRVQDPSCSLGMFFENGRKQVWRKWTDSFKQLSLSLSKLFSGNYFSSVSLFLLKGETWRVHDTTCSQTI